LKLLHQKEIGRPGFKLLSTRSGPEISAEQFYVDVSKLSTEK